jgi:hypothetical protein
MEVWVVGCTPAGTELSQRSEDMLWGLAGIDGPDNQTESELDESLPHIADGIEASTRGPASKRGGSGANFI